MIYIFRSPDAASKEIKLMLDLAGEYTIYLGDWHGHDDSNQDFEYSAH